MKVLNFGSMNIDYVYRVPHFVGRGETLFSTERNIFSGGKGVNQSVALARAGLIVYHAGCIGKEGTLLLDALRDAGVDTTCVRVLADVPTGHTVIQNAEDGDNCILLFGGANREIAKDQVDETLKMFEEGDYLVLQNEINNLAFIMEKAHEKGMKVVLNPSPMDEDVLKLPLHTVSYFFVNEIEASQLTGVAADDADGLVSALRERFPDAKVVLTLGANGSRFINGDEVFSQDIFPVRAVDTTAAGDTFTGFFLAGITEGKSPDKALELAARASAITVTRPGAAPSIPTREEVENALRNPA